MTAAGSKQKRLTVKVAMVLLMLLPVLPSFAQEMTAVFTEPDDFLIHENGVY